MTVAEFVAGFLAIHMKWIDISTQAHSYYAMSVERMIMKFLLWGCPI